MVDSETTATPWQPSPSGEWLTRRVKKDVSGPGNNFLDETVQVKRPGSDKAVSVMALDEGTGPAVLKLQWRDASNLVIMYANGRVEFQVAKVDGLQIETLPLASK